MTPINSENNAGRFIGWLIIPVLLLFPQQGLQALQPGDPAADLVLPRLDNGATVQLSAYRGKIVFVDFWASWCVPCRRSLPLYEAMYAGMPVDRFQILAVSLDEDRRDAERFLQRHPVSYPVLYDPAGVSALAWTVRAMPSSYLVDADGRLVHVYIGFEPAHIGRITHDVKTLLDDMSVTGAD